MSWLFCDSICDSLLQPLQVLVQEPLLLQYHCGEDFCPNSDIKFLL